MEFFSHPQMLPYSIALVVFFIFVALEVISLVIGVGLLHFLNNIDFGFDIDSDIDADIDTPHAIEVDNSFSLGAFFGYINPKRVPLSMLLMVFFFLFSFYGALLQQFLGFLSLFITLPLVLIATFFSLRVVSTILSLIIPKIESEAVVVENLIGHEAKIIDKIAKKNYPARAKVKDKYKNEHYIRVVPLNENEIYKEGDRVVIVKKDKNSNIFFVDISIWNSVYNKNKKIDVLKQ